MGGGEAGDGLEEGVPFVTVLVDFYVHIEINLMGFDAIELQYSFECSKGGTADGDGPNFAAPTPTTFRTRRAIAGSTSRQRRR